VKTNNVKEGTESVVDISTAKLDATEETVANTFTPATEKERLTI
jgi:hypothetical protein